MGYHAITRPMFSQTTLGRVRSRRLGQDDSIPATGVYAPGNILTPNPNSLNLPESTPITLDPNAAGIAAQQAVDWIPDTNAGDSYSAGSLFGGMFGTSAAGTSSASSSSSMYVWLGIAAVGAIAIFGLLKK